MKKIPFLKNKKQLILSVRGKVLFFPEIFKV